MLVRFAKGMPISPFGHHIAIVVSLSANEQVERVAAWRIIAMVKHALAL